MKQRTILFHRTFPDKRIAITSLRRLYLKHGIKRKTVRQVKVMPPNSRARFVENCKILLEKLAKVKKDGRCILYLDEICFTKQSIKLREWSSKNTNLTVD